MKSRTVQTCNVKTSHRERCHIAQFDLELEERRTHKRPQTSLSLRNVRLSRHSGVPEATPRACRLLRGNGHAPPGTEGLETA